MQSGTPFSKPIPLISRAASAPAGLSIVSAKDYVPGKENEILEGVQNLLVSSTKLVNRKFSGATSKTPDGIWESSKCEEKKSEAAQGVGENNSVASADWTSREMEGIMDSMTYVLEVMERCQAKAREAATKFLVERDLTQKTDKADKEGVMWDLKEVAKDISAADFLLGSFMPNQSGDVYPEGSQPILRKKTFLGPTADLFLGSIASALGMKAGDSQLDKRLRYLEDVQSVQSVCTSQIHELDTILSTQGLQTGQKPSSSVRLEPIEEFDNVLSHEGVAKAYELRALGSMSSENSVVTRDVEDKTHPPLNQAAMSYIQAARDRLSAYSELAQKILKDEIKCVVSEYTCGPEKYDGDSSVTNKQDRLYFEPLRQHFRGEAYNMDFKTYLELEQDDKIQTMLLNTLHSSLFLQNVGNKCQLPIRLHVGLELGESICDMIRGSIMTGTQNHRMTEWGAFMFTKHVRALHAYVYEFCRSTEGTDDVMKKVEKSCLTAPPMNPEWERIFTAMEILKLESLEDYHDSILHPFCTTNDARNILRLRTEFKDDAIDARVKAQDDEE